MGKGRAPCCDKSQVKRGPWSPAEDLRLVTFIQKHGHDNWRALPKQAGLLRCGKSCRLRWINYLRPDVKRGNFTKEEEDTIIKLHQTIGNKWSKIASYLPGRTDNEIKNVWNTHLKKRLATLKNGHRDGYDSKESSITTTTSSSNSVISGTELDLDSDIDQQWDHGPVTKKNRITETIMENSERESATKESSSPSMSSNNSNLTNFSQFDVSKPEDQDQIDTILFSDYIGPYDVQNALDEVNKPDQMGNNPMEIPLESDFDFWNMLDTLSTFQSNNEGGQDQLQSPDQANHESLNIGDACISGEVENNRWLRDLETELGLDTTKDGSQEKLSDDCQSLISESFDQYDVVPFRPETEIGYYHLWPSL